jgi:hypothetical protein
MDGRAALANINGTDIRNAATAFQENSRRSCRALHRAKSLRREGVTDPLNCDPQR